MYTQNPVHLHPIPGGVQHQVGWGPGQANLVGGNPTHGNGIRT